MDKILNSMLSTKDNPFDPFNDFDNWYRFDCDHEYNSCGILARLYNNSEDLPPIVEARNIEAVIDSFITSDPTNNYVKVQKIVEIDYGDEEDE